MKGEYVIKEMKDNNPSSTSRSSSMFAKLHQTHKFQNQPYPHPPPSFHHPISAAAARECQQTSEETDSPTTTKSEPTAAAPSSANDGASIEVVRRPRGRPPGSKNKPKPPVIISRDTEPSMTPYILELAAGTDIVDSITHFCRKRNTGICILTGSGTVTNVTLRQPTATPGPTVTFHGRFDILSISATIITPSNSNQTPPFFAMANGIANGFTISLAGPQGQVVGGAVIGPLLTAGTVYLIAASFSNPSYHRLPLEEDAGISGSGGGGGVGGESLRHSPQPVSGGDSGGHTTAGGRESSGMQMFSGGSHLGSDQVIWAPTARQPPPPPPY